MVGWIQVVVGGGWFANSLEEERILVMGIGE